MLLTISWNLENDLDSYPLQYGNWPWWNNPPIFKASMELANIVWMTQKPRKRDFRELKSEKFPGGACPPDLPQEIRFRLSIRKSLSIYPRSAPVPHILTLVRIFIFLDFDWRRRHTQGRHFLSSYFTMCRSKKVCTIFAPCKSLK